MEEKEIETFKPSTTIYVLLFIFYTIWMLQAFGSIGFHITAGLDFFGDYGLNEWLVLPLFLVGGFLCFYSVIKVLRGDKDCITALKWALMYSFLYTLFNSQRAQIPTYSIAYFLATFLARPLFYLGFYLYLCFSKSIGQRFPKHERKFAPTGWIWTAITACLIGFMGYLGYDTYKTNLFCKRVQPDSVMVAKGEICDGYVAFKSNRDWKQSIGNLDTIFIDDEKVVCEQTLEAIDSIRSIVLFSGRSEKHDVRTHNQILTKLLTAVDEDITEMSFKDTIADGCHLIYTVFATNSELERQTFTVATVFDTKSPKCAVFAMKVKEEDNQEWLKEIFRSIRWKLQSVADGKNKEDGGNGKNNHTGRTGNNNGETNTDMFACFFDGRTPSFLFSVVLLEHNKREITHSQGYNPFH